MTHERPEQGDAFDVFLADEALYALADIEPEGMYRRVCTALDTLARFPRYGEAYDPYYESARPPVPCRVFFVGHWGVYYTVDDDARRVDVIAIESARRDPRRRFDSLR